MTTPVSSASYGRSAYADQIYQQYINYYNDINTKISSIDRLPYTQQTAAVLADRTKLISLQQQLYPIYIGQYSNSAATLISFQDACATIVKSALEAYNHALGINTTPTPPTNTSPSPMNVFTNTQTSTNTSTPTTPTTTTPLSSTTTTTSTTSTTTVSTGRSKEADQIYSKYIEYYNEVNTKIGGLDQLPYNQRIQSNVVQARTDLLALQKQLAPIYSAQYNNSTATLSSFIAAVGSIMTQVNTVYNNAVNSSSTTQPITSPVTTPTTTPTNTTPPSTTPTTPPPSTTPTAPTTPTTPVTPITGSSSQAGKIENGTWYITWTSWTQTVPEGVNTVNIFVGNMHPDAAGKPVIDGFGTLSTENTSMAAFVQACKAKGITVKISIGGGGGSYDNCWDVLKTSTDVTAYAQALAKFCTTNGIQGVDFDPENFLSAQDRPALQARVGALIKEFKAINPSFQTSICSNAGFGPYFPWQGIMQNIFNAATYTDPSGKQVCAIDRFYIMSYFNSMSDEQGWITGWADWLKTQYNFTPAQVSVGLNSQSLAYDVNAFAAWAASKGYSTCFWDFNPGDSVNSNQVTKSIYNAYTGALK